MDRRYPAEPLSVVDGVYIDNLFAEIEGAEFTATLGLDGRRMKILNALREELAVDEINLVLAKIIARYFDQLEDAYREGRTLDFS